MTDEAINKLTSKVKERVHQHPDLTMMSDEEMRKLITNIMPNAVEIICKDFPALQREYASMTFQDKRSIVNAVYEAVRGLGILGQIIKDPEITEVMINGFDSIFIEKNGVLQKLESHFESQKELETIIAKFVSQAGRAVNEGDPIVDTRLEDGSRVNVVMPPIALNGPLVTIRRFPKEAMTAQKLTQYGSITPEVAEVLELLIKAKYNIFISGGTGSGKTTFLNALSNFIPSDERIITIEDSAELQIRNIPNLCRMETRNAGPDGSRAITMTMLIKSALRMRPTRIIVGEVRGEEALDMLQAMNTGHDGSLSTGHANSSTDMLNRLETMVLQAASGLPSEAIRQQIGSAVDIIIHLSRLRDGTRRTMEIVEVLRYNVQEKKYDTNVLYQFDETGEMPNGKVMGELKRTDRPMVHTQKLRNAGINRVI